MIDYVKIFIQKTNTFKIQRTNKKSLAANKPNKLLYRANTPPASWAGCLFAQIPNTEPREPNYPLCLTRASLNKETLHKARTLL